MKISRTKYRIHPHPHEKYDLTIFGIYNYIKLDMEKSDIVVKSIHILNYKRLCL